MKQISCYCKYKHKIVGSANSVVVSVSLFRIKAPATIASFVNPVSRYKCVTVDIHEFWIGVTCQWKLDTPVKRGKERLGVAAKTKAAISVGS